MSATFLQCYDFQLFNLLLDFAIFEDPIHIALVFLLLRELRFHQTY